MLSSRKNAGFSLVELMIALVLGLVITAVVTEIYIANKNVYKVQDAWSRLQENGRFAMQQLTSSIRSAGYMGCSSLDGLSVTNTLNNYASSYLWNFSDPVQGFNANGSNSWSPSLDSSISAPIDGADVLTVRGAKSPTIFVTNHPGNTSADIQVNKNNKLDQFDVVMVTDCINAAIFEITSANPNTSGSLSHNTGTVTKGPGNATKDLGKDYTGAEVYRATTTSFYIKNNTDGIPVLYKKEGSADATEVVPYVEDLQLEYGVDSDSDSSVDSYKEASATLDWSTVISVKLNLLLRSSEDHLTVDGGHQTFYFNGQSYTATDQRLRAAFTQIVNLRNRTP